MIERKHTLADFIAQDVDKVPQLFEISGNQQIFVGRFGHDRSQFVLVRLGADGHCDQVDSRISSRNSLPPGGVSVVRSAVGNDDGNVRYLWSFACATVLVRRCLTTGYS